MKNQLLQLGKYLFLSGALLFLGCQAEEIAVEQQANSEKEIILKKITFKEFRSNKNAFENFKKAQLKRSLASKNRGAYDESYGVFVDTSNIFVIERDGKHSITLQIESESDNSKIENLVLNSKDGGGYSAYIAEYQLSSQEQSVLLNGGVLPGKTPSHITSLETSSRINIGGNGADCIDIITRTVKMCHDANGNAQIDNGDLGNGCVGTFYELEVTTIMVDYECMAGGGGGGTGGTGSPGSPNTGSPGNTGTIGGGGDSGGFGGGGGTPGPGNDGSPPGNTGGNTGIPHNPDTSLTDGDGNPVLTTPILIVDRVRDFYRDLDAGQKAWWNNAENAVAVDVIKDYLRNSGNVDYSMDFGEELINALIILDPENEEEKIELINVLIYTSAHDYFNKNLDTNFFTGINNYSSINVIDPVTGLNFARLFLAHCAIIKQENPEWSGAKIFGRAYLDTVHLLLDFAGLIPAIGEIADLTNGTIYTIEGDGVNATLSYASSIPIAGWFSAGVKFAKRADGLKFLVVGADNLISFGAANSKKFRATCGIAIGDLTKQAHHIIPRGSQIIGHPIVQKAAKALTNQGFHIDQALNGIAVASWRNQPNHNQYNNLIKSKLDALPSNLTPNQAYAEVVNILNQAKQAIVNNPNVHLNDLNF